MELKVQVYNNEDILDKEFIFSDVDSYNYKMETRDVGRRVLQIFKKAENPTDELMIECYTYVSDMLGKQNKYKVLIEGQELITITPKRTAYYINPNLSNPLFTHTVELEY